MKKIVIFLIGLPAGYLLGVAVNNSPLTFPAIVLIMIFLGLAMIAISKTWPE